MDEKLEVKRIAVADIPLELHNSIKAYAAIRNMTMRDYILQAILEKIAREEKYQ